MNENRNPTRGLWPLALALATVVGTTACATNPDPADGGLGAGISGLVSGSYEGRVDEMDEELVALQNQQRSLEIQATRLANERQAAAVELQRAQQQAAKLDNELDRLGTRIENAHSSKRLQRVKFEQMQAELRGIEREAKEAREKHASTAQELRSRIAALEKQRRELEQVLEAALES